ncbi:hypothetical protein V3C99_016058 [Haemonchus contortus]
MLRNENAVVDLCVATDLRYCSFSTVCVSSMEPPRRHNSFSWEVACVTLLPEIRKIACRSDLRMENVMAFDCFGKTFVSFLQTCDTSAFQRMHFL